MSAFSLSHLCPPCTPSSSLNNNNITTMSRIKRKHNRRPNKPRSYVHRLLLSLLVTAVAIAFTTVCWKSTHDVTDIGFPEMGWVLSDTSSRELLIVVVPFTIYRLKSSQPKSSRLSVPSTTTPRSHRSPSSTTALHLSPQVSRCALLLLSISNWTSSTRRATRRFLTSSSCRPRKTSLS